MTPLARRTMIRRWMPDAGTIERPPANAKGVFDPVTGRVAVPASEVIYSGPMGIGSRAGLSGSDVGGAEAQTGKSLIRIPADAFDLGGSVREGDIVRFGPGSHPVLAGREYDVERALHDSSTMTLLLQVTRAEASTSRGAVS